MEAQAQFSALEYVNLVREKMHLPTLADMPERDPDVKPYDGKNSPAARALGCTVIKWRDPSKPCTAMTPDETLRNALVAAGGIQTSFTYPRTYRRGDPLVYDVMITTTDLWQYA